MKSKNLILALILLFTATSAGAIEKIVCDKCGSDDIEQTTKQYNGGLPSEINMSEWRPSGSMTLEYRPTTYVLRCRKCGFTTEVTQ